MSQPLVVVASEREGMGLVEAFSLQLSKGLQLKAGNHEAALGLYRGDTFDLLMSGVLEHHMVAATASALQTLVPTQIVNFGACGTYGNRFGSTSSPKIRDSVCISESLRFDVDDNLHWVPPRNLRIVDLGLPTAICVSGSRYSQNADYETAYFPRQGNVEDMELYGLAVLLETLRIPLYSIKYVTNEVGPHGRTQFRENVVAARESGQDALRNLLSRL